MSDYRDERASVKASVERLEGELAEARERLETLPKDVAPREVPSTDTPSMSSRVWPAILDLLGGAARFGAAWVVLIGAPGLLLMCAFWLLGRCETSNRHDHEQDGSKAREASMVRTVSAVWTARVVRAEGVYVPPDASCQLRVVARSNGAEIDTHAELSVRCGELAWERTGSECAIGERAKEPGAWVYDVRCRVGESWSPGGGRSSMSLYPEIDADTRAGRVRVRITHGTPSFLELGLEASSSPVAAEPLLDRH